MTNEFAAARDAAGKAYGRGLTLPEMRRLEPRLDKLLKEAAGVRNAGWQDYSRYKARLAELVGSSAQHPKLCSPRAYDMAIKALCRALDL